VAALPAEPKKFGFVLAKIPGFVWRHPRPKQIIGRAWLENLSLAANEGAGGGRVQRWKAGYVRAKTATLIKT
jgi:hypothetical protein